MSEHRCMLNKMNKIEIYVANEDTDINPSVQEAIEYVLKQNDPVGTVAGYYDEKLTIWSVSNYFLQLLGWDDLDEFMKASDGSMLSVVCNEQKHIFSPERLHDLQGSHILHLTDSKGLSIPVRIMKADARDNKGRPIWVLSVRSDHFARNQEAREAAFHRAFTDMNLCEYYVDLQENTFESMKVKGSLQEIFNKSRTWDELIQMFLNNYVCPESKEAVAQIYNREYIMKELRKITGELSQECKAVFDGEQRIIRNVVMEGDTDENGEVRHAMIFLRDVTDSKNTEKECRAMLKQNIAMDQLIQGVTRLVERFAVCDLDSGIYEYYEMNNESYYNPTGDYRELLQTHIDSGADITLLYHSVDNAREKFLNCDILNLNKQKGVESIEKNRGSAQKRNIFMDTYVMSKELFIELIKKARKISSMYTLPQIVNESSADLDIRGVSHRGYFASITDFNSYYNANISLIDIKTAEGLFNPEWPIYTKTNDSCPTQYLEGASVKNSVISNGCLIEGTVENSVIGRGCQIKAGAVIKNSIVLSHTVVGENAHLENQVMDKWAKVIHGNEIIAEEGHPGYIRREDVL